jgi:hypothetical protein
MDADHAANDRRQISDTIIALLTQRDQGKTICPSDAARALAGDRVRPLMQPVRDAAIELADQGRIEVTQRGAVIDPRTARGPIRYRLIRDDD